MYLSQRNIYGSSRIGTENVNQVIASTLMANIDINSENDGNPNWFNNLVGDKRYELNNHLGNVLQVITDIKLEIESSTAGVIDYYSPDVVSQTTYYPFGMEIPNLSGTDEYRYGFNGKEMDNEVSGNGNIYDYGFRIYNPRLGKFLSVDPLAPVYPWYTPYQFAGNMPIWAIDLDGLEEKIIVYHLDNDGSTISIETVTYNKVEDYGPLGNGIYTVHMKTDGTYTELFEPGEGNSIPSFSANNIKQARWIGDDSRYKGFEDRLNARLIEKIVENILIDDGFNPSEVREDVQILQSDDVNFKGRFATFKEGTTDKYTSNWDTGTPSEPHKSKKAKTSSEYGNSDVKVKYYDGAISMTDNIPNQIGLVREGWFDHALEALDATFNSDTNIGVENAKKVKAYAEAESNSKKDARPASNTSR